MWKLTLGYNIWEVTWRSRQEIELQKLEKNVLTGKNKIMVNGNHGFGREGNNV
jgi:hypothetical protein